MPFVLSHRVHNPVTLSSITVCRNHLRRIRARRDLTPQERANLRAACAPTAIVAASLGGGTHW